MRSELVFLCLLAIAAAKSVPKKEIAAKWVWKENPKHYIVNYKGSDVWEENFLLPVKYTFKEYTKDGGVILFTDSIKSYAKLTDDRIMYSRDINDLRKDKEVFIISSPGSWEIKPNKINPPTPNPNHGITAKWVFNNQRDHYIVARGNFWKEHDDIYYPTKYEFLEYTSDGGVIIYERGFYRYAKITDSMIYFHSKLNLLRNGEYSESASGRWEIKPKELQLLNPTPISSIPKPSNDVTGKWIFTRHKKRASKHYFLNRGGSDTWKEYVNKMRPITYTLVEFTNDGGIIIYSSEPRSLYQYAKITDSLVFYSDQLDELRKGKSTQSASGRWEIKPQRLQPPATPKPTTPMPTTPFPTTPMPTTPFPTTPRYTTPMPTTPNPNDEITGKWVYSNYREHYIINKQGSDLWEEFWDKMSRRKFALKERTSDGLILFDEIRLMYAKLTDNKIYFGKSLKQLNSGELSLDGHWEVTPKKIVPQELNTHTNFLPKPYARWVFNGRLDNFFQKQNPNNDWLYYYGSYLPVKYQQVEVAKNGDVILNSKYHKIYVKLTDSSAFFSGSLSNLKNGKFTSSRLGHWDIKPPTSRTNFHSDFDFEPLIEVLE